MYLCGMVLQVKGEFTASVIAGGGTLDASDIPPTPAELPTVPDLPGMPQTSVPTFWLKDAANLLFFT
jgi:hypothetical protein